MVERWHRFLKSALRTRLEEASKWTKTLPTVLLGLRSALRRTTGLSAAEAVLGQPLRLPGEIFMPPRTQEPTDASLQLLRQEWARNISPTQTKCFVSPDLEKCTHVFLREGVHKRSLTPPYSGPYLVRRRDDKTATVQLPGREDRVSLDRLKPAYLLEENQQDAPKPPGPSTANEEGSEHRSTRPSRTIRRPVQFET
ncbi:uncharacterized protein [Rhodnius prolixus]|uniref:uncharacterized protein n=1 Tax=Rhodnius prolixus TaxID=13249 RepID=UPI003D18F8DC